MKASEIFGFIYLGVLIVVLILFFVFAIRYDYLFKKRRKEYVEQLNEHDKSVIFDYEKKIFVSLKEVVKRAK